MNILTVVTPAASQDLTTLTKVKSILSVSSTSDAVLQFWIKQASGQIARFCNRVFVAEAVREEFWFEDANRVDDRDARRSVLLARYPVGVISTVSSDGVELAPADYRVDPESGLLARLSDDCLNLWSAHRVVVDYTAGYPADNIPAELEGACISLVQEYRSASVREASVKAETIEIPGIETVRKDYWVGAIPGSSDTDGIPPSIAGQLSSFQRQALG